LFSSVAGQEVFRFLDTCNVYVLVSGNEATLIDFGSGDVLDHLHLLGIDTVTDVLMTHHHRDQGQGLARAVSEGIRIWVPPVEQDLFSSVDEHWSGRPTFLDYNVRQDRFSILESVAIAGTVDEYRWRRYGGWDVLTIPTPGHTVGSVTFLVDATSQMLAFTGDLITAPGQVWSLPATQWTYAGVEGVAATILSAHDLIDLHPDLLLPSHGDPIDDPAAALGLLIDRLQALLDLQRIEDFHPCPPRRVWDLPALRARPYEALSKHLLRNRTSSSNTYALLSASGSALLIDYGYDMSNAIGLAAGGDRSARRPWLSSMRALHEDHGVDRIDAVLPTHYHDDHVAGFNLLREVEGASVWAPTNVTPILEDPGRFDLPCLWFDPIPVDRSIPLGEPFTWHEYELTLYELPGHTRYAVAIAFEVDGMRVVATGDQQDGLQAGERPDRLSYTYRNRFGIDDFVRSAELYRTLAPDLMISGHWDPRSVTPAYLDHLRDTGRELARLHRELLPLDRVDFGADGVSVRIEPYRSVIPGGSTAILRATVTNPFRRPSQAVVRAVVPVGWGVVPPSAVVDLGPREERDVTFAVSPPPGAHLRRALVAVDLTVGEMRFGQQAEALVDVPSSS
jgi:glyoxylase-like metal-dependent hydrolase (beta-lactamase superfamily II)